MCVIRRKIDTFRSRAKTHGYRQALEKYYRSSKSANDFEGKACSLKILKAIRNYYKNGSLGEILNTTYVFEFS